MTNKKRSLGLACLVTASCISFSASADFYTGAAVSYANAEHQFNNQGAIVEGSPFVLQAQVGYFFNDYVALEARYGTSIQRDSGLAIDQLASGFLKLNMPVSGRVAMYGLAGVSSVEVNQQGAGTSKENGFSFGLGLHYALDNKNAVVFEFVDNVSEESIRLNTMTIGFQHRF
ncbi:MULTISPECIES: outer membrane beta-barrel protein [Vibrio]|uniref:outer membrane beta-barrel protein n=1 Tax=Vibrio TaxID=662 RepID=UPI0005186285|nr:MULTISPECIES: outer membrane beta-barrel protein [Vibrio]CAE6880703.1 Outer membrane protein beta-barrel domain [Vibrio sp. B1FIG11]HDM8209035.1 porin family protein [Vibrio campbellii]